MTEEQKKRFNECIRSLPARSKETAVNPPEGETPEKALPVIDKHEDMKALIKVLSNINNNLQEINKTLRRMK